MPSLRPYELAKWTALGFPLGILLFMLLKADGLDVVVSQFVVLPWIIGPVVMAAVFARRTRSITKAWVLLVVELCAAASTTVLWALLAIYPDGQNGMVIVIFPAVQFAGVALLTLIVTLVFDIAKPKAVKE